MTQFGYTALCEQTPVNQLVTDLVAAEQADSMISVQPEADLVHRFSEAGGAGKPKYGQLPICYDRDENAARTRAREQWRWGAGGWPVMAELPDPGSFDAYSRHVREEDICQTVSCGPDVGQHVKAVKQYVDAGFTHVALVQVGGGAQAEFIRWAQDELLPALREL
jgi:G6PDH family F420-dependent oxidoreductase